MIKEMNWPIYLGQQVRVYRNLNNGRISIQAKVEKKWKVVGHVNNCVLESVQFTVRESGRQRVLRDRQKNVHAWAEGKLIAEFKPRIDAPIDLSYNPYEDMTFKQRNTQNAIVRCEYLVVRDNRVFVSKDAVQIDAPIDPIEYLNRVLNFSVFSLAAA